MDFDIERLQDIVSPYIIVLKQSGVVHVSDALASRMGISNKDDIHDFIRKDRTLLESFNNSNDRVSLPVKDREDFSCRYTNTTLRDAELLAFTDVESPREILSDEKASAFFVQMADHSEGSFLIVDKGHIVYANKGFLGFMGYEAGEVLGRQIISLISRENRAEFINVCEESLDNPGRRLSPRDIIFTLSSGKRHHALVSGGWLCYEGKDYLWLTAVNITEKIRLERLLKEERNRFSELFDLSPIGLLYISHRGIILECNEFICRIIGYSKEEIQGAPFTKFVVPHEEQRLREEFRALFLEGAGIHRHECLLRTKKGEDITIEYNVQVVSRKGHRIKALMVFSDVTDKKELEMELLEKNAETEKTLWEMAEVKDALEARAGELNRVTEELKVLNEKLNQLSITDGLTEIYNHRHFQDRLSEEVDRVNRTSGGVVSLLIIDIDDFKRFNDTYGHQCGDMVLKQLAGILKNSVRNIDILARYGGEEFAVILPNEKMEKAALVADRICETIRQTPFSFGKGISVKVTASIGVGTMTHGRADKAELVRKADNALYAAKAKWKDRVEVWEED